MSSYFDIHSFQSWDNEPCFPQSLSDFSNSLEFPNHNEPCSSRALESPNDDFSLVRHHVNSDMNEFLESGVWNIDRGRSSLILSTSIGNRNNQRSYEIPSCVSKVISSGVERGDKISVSPNHSALHDILSSPSHSD